MNIMDRWVSHADMVLELKKPGDVIYDQLDPSRADIWHAVTGIVTEAGELMDTVKKLVVYNKPLDTTNIVEELGDLEFYMEQVRQNLGLSRIVIIQENMRKLARRYPKGFTDKAAQERADK